ncbi:MAG: ribonuclease HII [Candidatus Treponema excrementipullorum]|nr:ribonuclease HII [Spirochaetia bacterium]MDD7011314.1 ribonuclease HII [Candidatus Treponema excrementipullorum]MCI6953439.1 ribonuclease HII [Spirochaetia bacterium]MCI7588332.1 ribonuclease HII [Spirochaetia bacterium]MDY2755703.1 ribonuclease HII [Candidatus Treponema excrementipullorum]
MTVSVICGFDEAGRGPMAGPVYAAAVILPPDFPVDILNDSKKLSEKRRLEVEPLIKERACWGIGYVDHKTIDEINILQSSLLAMARAFEDLEKKIPDFIAREFGSETEVFIQGIADGNFIPKVPFPCKGIPKADGTYPEVMAASILAKNERDRVMTEMGMLYPGYGYEKHKGYLTKEHKEALKKLGPSPIQRRSFKYTC